MIDREQYTPGPASVARVRQDGEKWTLILVRELRHPPEKVWQALTDPAQLREWAPFDAAGSLGTVGTRVQLTTVGAPTPHVTETTVTRADAPKVLEYNWGGFDMRWQLEAVGGGTRLTLWTNIDRRFISMGAAGWHICLDVLDHLLRGTPIGRIVGPEAMKFAGWQRLNAEYAKQFGIGTAAAFVGAWRLVSLESRDSTGAVELPLGQGVVGQLLYDAAGNMSAIIMKPERPPFASRDLRRGTDTEVRAAFEGFNAYFGTYTIDAAKGTVTHHVRAASYPNWVGEDQVRYYRFDGARLVLSTPPIQIGGRPLTSVLVWERVQ